MCSKHYKNFWYMDGDDWKKVPMHLRDKRMSIRESNKDSVFFACHFTLMFDLTKEDVTFLTLLGIKLEAVKIVARIEFFNRELRYRQNV